MLVYVINYDGQPLMPTKRFGKVRRMLNSGKAKVVNRCPFTIKLNYHAEEHVQPISLGIDAGSKVIGVSATTEDRVLYEAEVEMRSDVSDLLTDRRKLRRTRRNRKTRYRKPRFNNRTHAKKKGWLAPSVQHKVDAHLTVINKMHKLLPISSITVEVAQFDLQKLKAEEQGLPVPKGVDYQRGELFGRNIREYCFYRDNYTCQWCKGKSKDPRLHMHHWNYWRGDRTNKPGSVITLCETCNDSKNHKESTGFLWGWESKITKSYKDAAFMGIMRWTLYNKLKSIYPNVNLMYGYKTKAIRDEAKLPKEHYIDARCISGHPNAEPLGYYLYQKKVRCHNRQIHKLTINKGGYRKNNQAAKYVFGYQLFDKVLCKGEEGFIFGRRSSGSFDIRKLDGTKLSAGISYKKLKLLEKRKTYLTERRSVETTCTGKTCISSP